MASTTRAAKKAAPAKAAPIRPAAKKAVAKKAPAADAAPAGKSTPAKAAKDKKQKLVRDSFTVPKAEYAVLAGLKQRATALGRPAKKSELLRAGIKALAAMPDADFLAGVASVAAAKPAKAVRGAKG